MSVSLARRELSRVAAGRPCGVTIGVFDGVHRGHQHLIGVLLEFARREGLAAGDGERVGRLLGRPFSLRGPVVAGDRRGRTLGFPTANMAIGLDRALPAYGIYVTRVYVRESAYESCTSIGIRPTFDVEPRPVVETFILDFDEEIYGREMQIDLLHRLRGEERFASAEELIAQMEKDVGATREWFDTE